MRADWKTIRTYFVHHNVTQEECANKFKVSLRTLQTHCSKEKWISLREQKQEEVAQKSEEKITQKSIDRKVAANEKHYEQYSKLSEIIDLTLANYLEDIKSGDENSKALPYNLDYLAKIIKEIQRGQRLCLNIGSEESIDSQPEVRIIEGLNEDKI